ncbi:MAG: hypothetical protein HY234_03790 [Acidobacteria bacterium]|nr:hypothetical protein [Acidobacteriota bacterium]MBI3662159.1 hypothetical protein [Acidobacteriota bacterium]
MLDTMRAVLGDVLATAVELGHVVGPLNSALTDALGCAVRQATGLSVLVKETLKEEVYDSEKEEQTDTEVRARVAEIARGGAGAGRDNRHDDNDSDRSEGGGGPRR